ncbi:MAG: HEAT repeat domain-containing protein, partial [Verrucomicrobiales bacterium]|nr:HEAT repeat domain-containing protein [Verrucomicrobiales bacterium]
PLRRLIDTADAVGRDDASPRQRVWLSDADAGVRYWAALGLRARVSLEDDDRLALRAALQDASPVVRIEVATALASHDEAGEALPVLVTALHDDSREIALHAARALELLGPVAAPARVEMQTVLTQARNAEEMGDTMAMFVRFALEAALQP